MKIMKKFYKNINMKSLLMIIKIIMKKKKNYMKI